MNECFRRFALDITIFTFIQFHAILDISQSETSRVFIISIRSRQWVYVIPSATHPPCKYTVASGPHQGNTLPVSEVSFNAQIHIAATVACC